MLLRADPFISFFGGRTVHCTKNVPRQRILVFYPRHPTARLFFLFECKQWQQAATCPSNSKLGSVSSSSDTVHVSIVNR